eukprot:9195838-Alexandrium_andersonii.AAC.1
MRGTGRLYHCRAPSGFVSLMRSKWSEYFPDWRSGRRASSEAGPWAPAFEAQNAMTHAVCAEIVPRCFKSTR